MKALSLWQPWASLVTLGKKRYETRSWLTNVRGPIAIHAARAFLPEARELAASWPFKKYMPESVPLGVILGVATIEQIYPTEEVMARLDPQNHPQDLEELLFGDYSSGRYAWKFVNVCALRSPLPCRGKQGLWTLDADMEAVVLGALE